MQIIILVKNISNQTSPKTWQGAMSLDFADVFFVVNLFDRIGHGIVGRERDGMS